MTSTEHYDRLLADVYDWMMGGWDQRAAANKEQLSSFRPESSGESVPLAVDLGAGTGHQSVPLSELGFEVVAVDSSASMLRQIPLHLHDPSALPVKLVVGDALHFAEHIDRRADLIVCLTDTLSHLANRDAVCELFDHVQDNLTSSGHFVLSFRDLTHLPSGNDRLFVLRSTSDQVLTCFLEEVSADHVRVHDILHTADGCTGTFDLNISSYLKVRLSEQWVLDRLVERGLVPNSRAETKGLITLILTSSDR